MAAYGDIKLVKIQLQLLVEFSSWYQELTF